MQRNDVVEFVELNSRKLSADDTGEHRKENISR